MPKKGYTPEQIINKLREAEIMLSQGNAIACNLQEDRGNRPDLLPLAKRIWRHAGRSSSPAQRIRARKHAIEKSRRGLRSG